MLELDIPICPECGRLGEDAGENEVYCEHCYTKFIHWLRRAMGGPIGIAQYMANHERDIKLGVGLDRQPDVE